MDHENEHSKIIPLEIRMIEFKQVHFQYQHNKILENFSARFESNSIVSILGPSGVGKTSFLKLISGLQLPFNGEVIIDGKNISGPSNKRVMIFQEHLLFPWMTSKQNIEFVLKATGQELALADHYLNLINLRAAANHFPHELSGGMKQRVGIARALAAKPDILLLDEPFASLDAITRDLLIVEITSIIKKLSLSAFFVSHNIEEAVFLSDRVVLLNQNKTAFDFDCQITFTKGKNILELKHQKEFIEIETEIYNKLKGN